MKSFSENFTKIYKINVNFNEINKKYLKYVTIDGKDAKWYNKYSWKMKNFHSRNNKFMTITEIAEIAGVSPATVSRVFNHSEMVSENTKQKVLKAIKEYDYIPNPSFGNLSLQRIF